MPSKASNSGRSQLSSASEQAKNRNPAEFKIDLLCRGLRIDPSCELPANSRPFPRSPAGLGSGLELILPGENRELWVNVPVLEKFVGETPYVLLSSADQYRILDEKQGGHYEVKLPLKPEWYDEVTSNGLLMSRVGTLHGTCLSVYIGDRCHFWKSPSEMRCSFCNLGLDPNMEEKKTVEDVLQTALAAQRQSKATFVLLNSGYQGAKGLAKVFPYVEALKKQARLLVGIQFIPERDLQLYDQAIDLGVDHISFCFEFYNPECFTEFLPGKAKEVGRTTFFRALEYCARKLGKGRVSGELIAGVEPLEDTLRAIEYIGYVGAYPVVCVFRPLTGAEMEDRQPPQFSDMLEVFRHVYKACRLHRLPIGVAPNIGYSLSLQPEDTLYLAGNTAADRSYRRWLWTMKQVMRPHFARRTARG